MDEFRKRSPYEYDSDPAGELFPNCPPEANGRRIGVRILATLPRALAIEIAVRRTTGGPLSVAAFLLHPTFQNPIEIVNATDDVATLTVYSEGAFTVVAIVDDGKTILSYPLLKLPGAPQWFRDN